MHRLLTSLLLLLTASLLASAQEFPRTELFGGFSYLHLDTQGINNSSLQQECNILFGGTCPATFQIHRGFNGWEAAGQYNANRWFGLKADFAGHYGTLLTAKFSGLPPLPPLSFSSPHQHMYDFLFGPVISYRSHRYTAFVHGLIGAEHTGFGTFSLQGLPLTLPSTSSSRTDFAFALGGGLDINLLPGLALRPAQIDYQFVRTDTSHQNNLRISSGLVIAFGGQ